ncbi:hypothetical protein NUACC26_021370 [Scytonema sp. NUACC26]
MDIGLLLKSPLIKKLGDQIEVNQPCIDNTLLLQSKLTLVLNTYQQQS